MLRLDHRIPTWIRIRALDTCAFAAALSALLFLALTTPGLAQSPNLVRPEGHFTIENPGMLSDSEALVVYNGIRRQMHSAYDQVRNPATTHFGEWQRYNSAPYVSATHGQRYVNNYANRMARDYGRYEESGPMPVGAVLVKDSFTVTKAGNVFAGALFIMEKMPPGFNAKSHDWRYTMVLPDGTLFGITEGEGSKRVAFCITCHEAAPAEHHQMFYVPKKYRVEVSDPG